MEEMFPTKTYIYKAGSEGKPTNKFISGVIR